MMESLNVDKIMSLIRVKLKELYYDTFALSQKYYVWFYIHKYM